MADRLHRILTIAMLVLFLSLVASVGYLAANPELTTEPYTEFYLLGPDANTTEYPETLEPGETANITVGISNNEHRRVTYRLDVQWNSTTTEERTLTIPAGTTREVPITLRAPTDSGRYRVELVLHKQGSDDEPLTTRLWVRVQ